MKRLFLFFPFLFLVSLVSAQRKFTVQADKIIAPVSPTMWGIFFEDINFAADGGLYAEMIKNRSFEFAHPLMGWTEQKYDRFSLNKESGFASIYNHGDNEASGARFARITTNADKGYGLTNEGFRGMGIKKDLQCEFFRQ